MTTIDSSHDADRLLRALGDQLGLEGATFELVVVGGSALLTLGLTQRATRDVDVLAVRDAHGVGVAAPLPHELVAARNRVARDFALPEDWLNDGPASLLDFGLPAGFEERLERKQYGPALTVAFAARLDQIHFKLYAAVDHNGPGKHLNDLVALDPTREELLAAARWSRQHDPSGPHRQAVVAALTYLGVADADDQL